ncbi:MULTISPECIES: hypothetical protein [unclassified Rhodococcus (in: high G+C Gram-positive bacteria)]|uniref:hypothetical protein n=1 Tax=unclassified Rhodococcus (in: high G+C Gram-positive bacteria) TaxID=192944 RepID=UPI001C56C8D6|nr:MULTISPECIES: hypothetical protein [unclassified Rhodococcus (in: high G+C Gram-positive bacteria)]QXU56568.1 hypothetical protein KXC42_25930 [Rhodococcus sp. LW-XY12]WML60912.1 hypothetical protein QNA09_00740 [Rhodococcus sp. AH-ZY2]
MTDSGVDDDALVPVTVLLDREDDAHLTHTLLRAHTLASAVVTVHPTPGASTAAALADDLLLALGHSLDRAGADGASGPDSVWRAVTAWIRGDEIRHLIVLRAHRLSAAQHARLFRLRHDAGVHLVLVWHSRDPLAPRLAMPAGVRPHITDDLVALTGRLPPPRRDTPAPTDAAELPAVPDSDCATFLPAAAAALSRADYTRVAAVYHQAAETTSRRLTACGRDPDLARRMLGYLPALRSHLRTLYGTIPPGRIHYWHAAVGLSRLLGDLVADSPGRNYTLTRLRGAQAAFERHGVPLVLPPHLNHMVGVGLTTTPITEQIITRIRTQVANPAHAAALATLLFTGTTYRELNFLPRRALIGDTLVFPGTRRVDHPADLRVWVIPPPARPLLHAAALFQEARTVPTARLFADAIGPVGRLNRTARVCRARLPGLHPWREGWIRHIAALNLDPGQP